MNNITINGKKYRAKEGNCTNCAFWSYPNFSCTKYPKTQCVSSRRMDGRNIIWIAVKHKEKQHAEV